MPIAIPLDLSNVESYDSLPVGRYFGQIDKVEYRPTDTPGKFDQIMVTYMVSDGELLGRKQSEFLSLSPKAAFRLKKWLEKFADISEFTELEVDEDTNLVTSPDFVGVDVLFEIYQDPKLYQGEIQFRCRLVEVNPSTSTTPNGAPATRSAPPPAPAPTRAAPPARAAAPAAPPARAAAPAPVTAEEAQEQDPLPFEDPTAEEDATLEQPEEQEEAPAPTLAPRRTFSPGVRQAAAPAAGPARRVVK